MIKFFNFIKIIFFLKKRLELKLKKLKMLKKKKTKKKTKKKIKKNNNNNKMRQIYPTINNNKIQEVKQDKI